MKATLTDLHRRTAKVMEPELKKASVAKKSEAPPPRTPADRASVSVGKLVLARNAGQPQRHHLVMPGMSASLRSRQTEKLLPYFTYETRI